MLQNKDHIKPAITIGATVFQALFAHYYLLVLQEWNINRLSFEYDSEPFGKERDAAIKKLASEAGVEVMVQISHTLYDLDRYVYMGAK